MRFIASALLALLLLAGCASTPRQPPPARGQLENFSLEARFALRVNTPDGAAQNSGGRLSWLQKSGKGRILLSNPLGFALAEIESEPGHASLRATSGEIRQSDNPDSLIEEITGQRLPVQRLPDWLLGRAGSEAKISHDLSGRPQHLEEAGWAVDYHYDSDGAEALPSRLTISRGSDIELRLRIEEWSAVP